MRIRVQLPAGAVGAGEARKVLDELGRETPKDVLSTLELLVSELVANSPRHSDEGSQGVLVKIETSTSTIRAEIVDVGTGTAAPSTSEENTTSGWDVFLLEEMSSRWGIVEGSTDGVWFEIDRWTRNTLGPQT